MIEASVLVVGAGAIGGVAAAKMGGGVRRVSVLDANDEHVERMRDPGLLLDELGEERHVRLDAHADPSDFEGPFDFALVTLKAPHLESALGPLVERGLARTFVSLGNGLVQDRIAAIVERRTSLSERWSGGLRTLEPAIWPRPRGRRS